MAKGNLIQLQLFLKVNSKYGVLFFNYFKKRRNWTYKPSDVVV